MSATPAPNPIPQARAEAALLRRAGHRRPRGSAPPAAGGRRAARRVRPAPRSDRQRARHQRGGREGSAPPGPPAAAGPAVPVEAGAGARRRGGRRPCGVTTSAFAPGRQWSTARPCSTRRSQRHVERLPALPGRARPVPAAAAHASASSATSRWPVPRRHPGRIDGRRQDSRPSHQPLGRRAAYAGALAATAAGAAGAICSSPSPQPASPPGRLSRPPAERRRIAVRGPVLSLRLGHSSPCTSCPDAGPPIRRAVAQLVEHRSPKPAVGGSSPSCPARPSLRLAKSTCRECRSTSA